MSKPRYATPLRANDITNTNAKKPTANISGFASLVTRFYTKRFRTGLIDVRHIRLSVAVFGSGLGMVVLLSVPV